MIIPARSGSKRIKNKNIRVFCGRPIIAYSLEAAHSSGLFHEIHVSTDSRDIANRVEDLGYKIRFMRPKELSGDETPLFPVFQFIVEKYASLGFVFDEVWVLMACAPLITASMLLEVEGVFEKSQFKKLMGVGLYSPPIEWAYKLDDMKKLTLVSGEFTQMRSQDLIQKYYDAGVFYCYKSELFKNDVYQFFDEPCEGYLMPRKYTIDIDTEEDWELAKIIYESER